MIWVVSSFLDKKGSFTPIDQLAHLPHPLVGLLRAGKQEPAFSSMAENRGRIFSRVCRTRRTNPKNQGNWARMRIFAYSAPGAFGVTWRPHDNDD